jgi:hypothetical protein
MSLFAVSMQYMVLLEVADKLFYFKNIKIKVKGKAIPVTSYGGPCGCETLRLAHFLDDQLTDGGEVVSFTHQPAALYPQEDA